MEQNDPNALRRTAFVVLRQMIGAEIIEVKGYGNVLMLPHLTSSQMNGIYFALPELVEKPLVFGWTPQDERVIGLLLKPETEERTAQCSNARFNGTMALGEYIQRLERQERSIPKPTVEITSMAEQLALDVMGR